MAKPWMKPLPEAPPLLEEGDDEDSSSASSVASVGTVVPRPRDDEPPTWHDFYQQELWLRSSTARDIEHHAYLTPPRDPTKDPLFVCHHGAGSSAMSFAMLAAAISARMPEAGILAADARDHGLAPDGQELDFSLDTLSKDFVDMVTLCREQSGWIRQPSTILVGHSLGGAVVTNIAKQGVLGSDLIGFAVIDVVEGSAMEALKSMQSYLASRPSSFPSIKAATDWHVRSRTIRNRDSAMVSTPSLLRETTPEQWTWRTDLTATKLYWSDWFGGMSTKFLAGRGAKLLLLAGTDRLDKDLMIGQMQGKFQLQVIPEAGHFVQEDVPDRTADILLEFYHRNNQSSIVLPPKVGDMLAQGKKV